MIGSVPCWHPALSTRTLDPSVQVSCDVSRWSEIADPTGHRLIVLRRDERSA